MTALLLGMLCLACGDDAGSTPEETGGQTDAVEDAGVEGDLEPTNDAVGTPDTSRACIPGVGVCRENDTVAELCNDYGEWEITQCEEDEICFAGICGPVGVCEPGEVDECRGYDRYFGCNPVGTGRQELAVPFNQTCITNDEGVAELVSRHCLAGQTLCEDEEVLTACAPSGLEYEFATNCQEDDETTLCDDGQCVTLCQYIEKKDTYVGCEYWAVDLDNAFVQAGAGVFYDAYHASFAVAISNVGETLTADIRIESLSEVLAEGSVEPGQMEVFRLPYADIEGTMHGFMGYRVTSTVPIVAYQFNPLDDENVFSNDASLLLPTSSLGTEYYVMTRRQTFEVLKSTLTIVATQEGETNVRIELPDRTDTNPMVTLSGSDIPPMEGGEVLEWTLSQYEVLNIETNHLAADFTGTYVTSDRPLAVFGGTEASNAPNTDSCIHRERQGDWVCEYDRETPCFDDERQEPNIALCRDFITCCADHLEQQMLPISAWGREYNAARSAPRGDEADIWRIIAGADETQVTLVGIPDAVGEPIRTNYTIDEGEWFEFESRADFEILATGPIMLGQFLAAEQAPEPWAEPHPPEYPNDAGTGDPAFMLGVPREQYLDNYVFLVPREYEQNWVTIVAPVGMEMEHEDEDGTETLEADMFTPFATEEYAVLRYALENTGYHRLTGEQPFGVMVHGYDQYVSYGYPAGLNLKKINRRRGE
jgi:hypothetical protein